MACWTVVIFSASSSGISVSNSSSSAITSSTVSSESAPRSSTKEDSFLISASFTPSCSAMIFLTRCSMFSIRLLLPLWDSYFTRIRVLSRALRAVDESLRHEHSAVDVQHRAGDVIARRRREKGHGRGYVFRLSEAAERNLSDERAALLF